MTTTQPSQPLGGDGEQDYKVNEFGMIPDLPEELTKLADSFATYVWALSPHNFVHATHHQYKFGRDLWLREFMEWHNAAITAAVEQAKEDMYQRAKDLIYFGPDDKGQPVMEYVLKPEAFLVEMNRPLHPQDPPKSEDS